MPNSKFLASIILEIWRGYQNFKSRSCDHLPTPWANFAFWILFVSATCDLHACQIWSFWL